MKFLQKSAEKNLLVRGGVDKDIYDAQLNNRTVVLIDREENIIDILPRIIIRLTIDEAEDLVDTIKIAWPDWDSDPYYLQGPAVYPIIAITENKKDYQEKKMKGMVIYRYKLAGEWIYGVKAKTGDTDRYLEAPVDGWERWLEDHKRVMRQAWTARYA